MLWFFFPALLGRRPSVAPRLPMLQDTTPAPTTTERLPGQQGAKPTVGRMYVASRLGPCRGGERALAMEFEEAGQQQVCPRPMSQPLFQLSCCTAFVGVPSLGSI